MAANSMSHGTCINLQHVQGLCMVFFLRHALHILIWCMSPLMVGMYIRVCIYLQAFIIPFLSFALYDFGYSLRNCISARINVGLMFVLSSFSFFPLHLRSSFSIINDTLRKIFHRTSLIISQTLLHICTWLWSLVFHLRERDCLRAKCLVEYLDLNEGT